MLDLAQYQIGGSTAREIASSAEASIREGLLRTGDQLPTVRALAERLGTSPATVNAAYRILRQRGLVVGDGRRGTRVAPRPAVRPPPGVAAREASVQRTAGVHDLAIGLPDPELLLPVAIGARANRLRGEDANLEPRVDRPRAARAGDGVVSLRRASSRLDRRDGGAFDGVERVLQAHLRPGDRVIIEDPAYTSIRDLLLALGLVAVPVPVDEFGVLAEPFEARLEQGVEAVLLVPRAQNPFGSAIDAERMSELQAVISKHPDVADGRGRSRGGRLGRLVFDDRDAGGAAVGGDPLDLEGAPPGSPGRADGRRRDHDRSGRGPAGAWPRWVSHVLQAIVVELLTDPGFTRSVARARDAYAARREAHDRRARQLGGFPPTDDRD